MIFAEPQRIEAIRLEAEQIVLECQVHRHSLEDCIAAIVAVFLREKLPLPDDPIAFATGNVITLEGIMRAALKRSVN